MSTVPSELINQATRHAVFIERLKTGEANKFLPFLKRIDRDIRDRLSRVELTELGQARFDRLLAGVEGMLRDVFGEYRKTASEGLIDFAKYEASWAHKQLDQITQNYEPVMPAVSQIRAAALSSPLGVQGPAGGKLLTPFLQGFSDAEVDRLTSAIRISYFQGESTGQAVRRIRGTAAAGYRDGVLAITERSARAVIRTATSHMSSMARAEVYRENDDLVRGYQWVSTLDARTSSVCQSLDGRIFKMGQGPMPPAHPNCRSSTVPVLDDRFSFLDKGATRASVGPDGGEQVPAKQSYYDWLKKQPAEFQSEAIGPVRAKLLQDGGLSAEAFSRLQLDKNFQPMTLDDMRRLDPLAFKRAGIE
jgi:SPP1 gp7 family putative phage head morphogenesis protein